MMGTRILGGLWVALLPVLVVLGCIPALPEPSAPDSGTAGDGPVAIETGDTSGSADTSDTGERARSHLGGTP